MPHNRSPNSCGSLSDRALRPWPEAAVLLIDCLCWGALHSAPDNSSKQRGAFPYTKRPAICSDSRTAVCPGVRKTLLGRLRCCSKLIAAFGARPCWAEQPCWRYLPLCRLQAPKIRLRQILQRRRKRLKSRRHLRRLLQPHQCRRHQHLHRRRRPRRHRRLHRCLHLK